MIDRRRLRRAAHGLGRAPRKPLAWLLVSLLLCLVRTAAASEPEPGKEQAASGAKVEVAATPIFGEQSLPYGGWSEMVVRVSNQGDAPASGEVAIYGGSSTWTLDRTSTVRASYNVAAGAAVSLRVPIKLSDIDDPKVAVRSEAGDLLLERVFTRSGDNRTLLVDVSSTPGLGVALRGIIVGSRNDPWENPLHAGAMGGANPSTVEVVNALTDKATGDPLLPRRSAAYARIAALLMRSDTLTRIQGAELEALVGYVLAGGTLAVIITRPEDMRHPTIAALAGAPLGTTTVAIETMREVQLSKPSSPGGMFGSSAGRTIPPGSSPPDELVLVGYEGGNLRPSSYGASAPYGLGEVHFLAFDPQQPPGVDSPWVHVRLVDMLRRANERLSGVLFRPGSPHPVVSEVRRQLDPNEGSRWAIIVSALLLCLYAVVAGPVNYTYWRKKHHPLRALLWVPVLSGATFGLVAVIGIAAKGCSGRARHLTVIEAGGGMSVGSARRWRGFFVPSARDMTIYAGNASSVVAMEQVSAGDEVRDLLIADKNGMRVSDLPMRPWETVVVREDGPASLGEGITLAKVSPDETNVVNRTGRRLRGVILSQPHHGPLFLESLDDGASVSSKKFASKPRASNPSTPRHVLPLVELNPYGIDRELEQAAPGLADAWLAVIDALGGSRDWFPSDVPVLLAQIEGGEGIDTDAGLTVDSDRLLVRVVGYGGRP